MPSQKFATHIRPMQPVDLPTIIALDREIFGGYGADESPEVIGARLAVFPAGCVVLEATEQESVSIAGYLTTEKWSSSREPALDEDPYSSHQPDGKVLCITTLAVAPTFQRRGIGPQLLEQALLVAAQEKCSQIILETAHAQGWYERLGFATVGKRIERGIPLFIMQKYV